MDPLELFCIGFVAGVIAGVGFGWGLGWRASESAAIKVLRKYGVITASIND